VFANLGVAVAIVALGAPLSAWQSPYRALDIVMMLKEKILKRMPRSTAFESERYLPTGAQGSDCGGLIA
jgi:hypothetical protein